MSLGVRILVTIALTASVGLAPSWAAGAGPTLAGCPVLPADSVWNARVDELPVHPRSREYIASIGPGTGLHPDFGSGTWEGAPIGIPYTVVSGAQARVPIGFYYPGESDPGPYPIPPNPPIEGGPASTGDRHVLVVDRDRCLLYEVYDAWPQEDGSWQAGSGAVFDLRSNALRPETWTSADAAGLPILPGLVRWDEVATGEIRHALRFTARRTQRSYVWPARHYASSITDPGVPPMGQRFRLRASFDLAPYPSEVRVILQAMKTYGLILADNGSDWYISGVPDPHWTDDVLVPAFLTVTGQDFEAVDVSGLMVDPASGQAVPPGSGGPGGGPPVGPTLALTVSQASFGTGDTLRIGLRATNGGPPVAVDLYLAVRLPDGVSAAFLASLAPPSLAVVPLGDDPSAFPVAARDVVVPTGLDVTLPDLVRYTFLGSEPAGEYAILAALARPGSLADGRVDAGDLVTLTSVVFAFRP